MVLLLALVVWNLIAKNPFVAALIAAPVLVAAAAWLIVRIEASRRTDRQRIAFARDVGALLSVTPQEFEHTVAAVLRASGYDHVAVRGGSDDLAADITCIDRSGAPVVVQCKQFGLSRKVGTPEVQTFIGMAFTHPRETSALYVTTADYTKGARELAAEHGIALLNGADFLDLARCAGASSRGFPPRHGHALWQASPV